MEYEAGVRLMRQNVLRFDKSPSILKASNDSGINGEVIYMTKPGRAVYKECEFCLAGFRVCPSNTANRFCSRKCYNLSRKGVKTGMRTEVTVATCPACLKGFLQGSSRSGYSLKRNKFCSIECKSVGRIIPAKQVAKEIDLQWLSYVAGILDGEGCIGVTWHSRGIRIRVAVANTSRALIDKLVELTGLGCVAFRPRPNVKHKDVYTWIIQSGGALSVLKQCRPFLVVKAEQADIAIEAHERLQQPHMRFDLTWQKEFKERMNALNKRGKPA